jgi:hypothetical protein
MLIRNLKITGQFFRNRYNQSNCALRMGYYLLLSEEKNVGRVALKDSLTKC